MKSLIIGQGEVGKSLYNVIKKTHTTYIRDIEDNHITDELQVLHITYPDTKGFNFAQSVFDYWYYYKDVEYIIVHSTVRIGTMQKIRELLPEQIEVYHSPIRGVHPNLEEGVTTFAKFISGNYNSFIQEYFSECDISLHWCDKYIDTELMKLLSTTYYGWNIVFAKEVKKLCDKYGADFENVYTVSNETYNSGYTTLGKENVVRPVLEPTDGPIGGHCVIPNAELLKGFKPAQDLCKYNDNYTKGS